MKIGVMLFMLYTVLVGIILFDNIANTNGNYADPYNYTSAINNGTDDSALWKLFMNPQDWTTNWLMTLLVASFIITGASATVSFFTKSDIALLSPIFILMVNSGVVPIVAIYTVVHREALAFMCSGNIGTCTAQETTMTLLLVGVFVGTIALFWIFTCVEWWTQRPAT